MSESIVNTFSKLFKGVILDTFVNLLAHDISKLQEHAKEEIRNNNTVFDVV